MNQASEDNQVITSKKSNKKVIKVVLTLLGIVVLLICAWYTYKVFNPSMSGPRIHPLSLVPQSSLYVVETDRPYKVWSDLSKTSLWDLLKEDEEWHEYGQMLSDLEGTMSDFDMAMDLLVNRTTYISAHPYRSKDYDFLYVFDLEGLGVLRTWMVGLDHVTKRDFEGQIIYEKLDIESKDTFYFSFVNNFLIASYTHSLVEESIKDKTKSSFNRSFDFLDVYKKTIDEGLVRVYVNYDALYKYFGKIIPAEEAQDMQRDLPLVYTGAYFDIDEESLFLEGYSNYQDSAFTYLNVFKNSGTGGTDIARVIPSKTSIYASFGFNSFLEFYQSLEEEMSEDTVSGEEFMSYTRRTEKFLGIDLEEDLASWIDDEIAMVQVEYEKSSETAFVIKAKNADLAQEKMAYLSKQIKRKTPVRFKSVEYQSYQINYMAVKGLFSLVLGGLFEKIDRPYYTIIDEYVVFSGTPQALRRIIDDKLAENTLSEVSVYKEFIKKLGEEHSMLVYMQLELMKDSKDGLIDEEFVELLQSKSTFLSNFPQLGFSVIPAGDMLETKVLLSIKDVSAVEYGEILMPNPFELNFDSLLSLDPGESIEVEEIEIEDLGAKKQTETYEEGAPKYEIEVKDGLKHGSYYEYYPTEELKVKGKYKNDLKEGVWKYYTQDGELEKKERYKKGELVN